MDGELAEAIETMASGDDNFALLLDHEYTQNCIRWFGSGALKGVDRARGLALGKANSSVSAEKKLQFYLVELHYQTAFYGNGGDKSRQEKAIWYSAYGSWVGPGDKVELKLNFLNPCHETHAQRWRKPYGSSDERVYTGNERRRYAIVAWPMADDAENAVKFVNIETAAEILAKLPSMDTAKLRKFMDAGDAKLAILDARDKECQADPRRRQEKFMPVGALWDLCRALSKLSRMRLTQRW
ncbi:hypothetical protein PHYSODRAFT_326951 [Phytophthora sojae]|uniref:Uncharacterized protein n=1 Tax=Phytophthora sojae (strain P6497) TaxID=1094619 RepID=G4YUS9_PHYSP|nr:hypothetical protein PHYSODRAFT_326951 [Phytophthora sojae]EGZ26004.1 hypothetical protein PHYSODRAFT_326951 [Phytophthora sojae]|eukprot:XP_009521292.1 hypothetical protein PHYSODRAFT_326951 [Phytophthora sojae]